MDTKINPITILVAEDDEDDRFFIQEALAEARLANDFRFVKDGQELLDYLQHRGSYTNEAEAPYPGLILLDLNMPRKDGHEAIREIKADPNLRRIPIVVMTTSNSDEDIANTYDLGISGYITKPVTLDELVMVIKALTNYWFQIVKLPN